MTGSFQACLTPPGTAAIATLGLVGSLAWPAVRALFQPVRGTLPEEPPPGRTWFGRLGGALGQDEVVLAVKRADVVEVHCHGGAQVVRMLQEVLLDRGLRMCTWQNFQAATGMPRWQVRAQEALAQAPTVRTAAILLDQYHGALHVALQRISAHLQRGDKAAAVQEVHELHRYRELGRHLVEPWRVVIAGAPNVGKSSLVNALAGFTRSIVSHEPGTTRDVVTTRLAVDGWPVEVADTAGWRDAAQPLEQAGIARAQAAAANADLTLWVVDGAASAVLPETLLPRSILVINKVDLPPAWNFATLSDAVHVSATTGTGVTDLCHGIARALVPEVPPPGAAVPFDETSVTSVDKLRQVLLEGNVQEAATVFASLS